MVQLLNGRNAWKNGRMDARWDARKDGRTDRCAEERLEERTQGWMGDRMGGTKYAATTGSKDKPTSERQMEGRTDARASGWKEGRTGGRKDELMDACASGDLGFTRQLLDELSCTLTKC